MVVVIRPRPEEAVLTACKSVAHPIVTTPDKKACATTNINCASQMPS